MQLQKLSRPWLWLYNLAGRVGNRRGGGVTIIGGQDGPTAIYIAGKGGRGRRRGTLRLQLDPKEALIALGMVSAFIAAVAALSAALLAGGRRP